MRMSRERWLALRRTGIGGSDAAAVAGVGLWASPLSVYLDKVGEAEPREPTERMNWGLLLEKPIAAEFARREGVARLRPGKFGRLNGVRHWIGTPDFLGEHPAAVSIPGSPTRLDGPVVIEVKVSDVASDWTRVDDADMVPLQYFLQVQHYLMLVGYEVGYLTVLVKGSELRTWRIERDNDVLGSQMDVYADFWQHVKDRIPPEPDGSEASAEALRRMYPRDDGTERVATLQELELVVGVRSARARVRAEEANRDRWENQLKAAMRTTTRLVFEHGSVSWRQNKPSEFTNWEGVAGAYRKLLDETATRTLGLKVAYTRDDLDALVSLHSGTHEGARPLRITVKGDEG